VYHYRTSQKETSELKTQLKMVMANEELVRLLKEELKEKSHKYKELESENDSLKRSLEVKVRI
jgi:cell shape-determining protein MreC